MLFFLLELWLPSFLKKEEKKKGESFQRPDKVLQVLQEGYKTRGCAIRRIETVEVYFLCVFQSCNHPTFPFYIIDDRNNESVELVVRKGLRDKLFLNIFSYISD